MKSLMNTLEMAKDMSTYNNCPIYVFVNGKESRVVAKMDWFDEVSERLTKEGYYVECIFESGKRL